MIRRPAARLALLAATVGLTLPAAAVARKLRATAHSNVGSIRTSSTTTGASAIGVLFANATTTLHRCTAAVVDSAKGDLLITAAHCVSGTGTGMVFVPDAHDGQAPLGRWTVTAVYVARAWRTNHDPADDVAFLTVAPREIDGKVTSIQAVTGGYRLGSTAATGESVTVTGYPAGTNNDPITCTATVYMTRGYPSFDCRGYVGGTSGTPWLSATAHGPEIVGVIGGLHAGGCYDYTSYSPLLARTARSEYRRAATGAPGNVDPGGANDGCG